MRYRYPQGLYGDVRFERVCSTQISFENGELRQCKESEESGFFIRLFDGRRWYYTSMSEESGVQDAINELAKLTKPDPAINEHPIVKRFEVHKEQLFKFADSDVRKIPCADKRACLESYLPVVSDNPKLSYHRLLYMDRYLELHFSSSKGAELAYDKQYAAIVCRFVIAKDGLPAYGQYVRMGERFDQLKDGQADCTKKIDSIYAYAMDAVPVKAGVYPCILSPLAAGIFAHESFGHKSEADFMVGDETMLKEWELGKQVGSSILSIVDDGTIGGNGYTPFDDEGTSARCNYLIRDGKLVGRLHSAMTAADLNESVTGNARAVSFLYEPIVRMTTTYIAPGSLSKEALFSGIKEGVFIDDVNHGSGMSTFTLAPATAYMIRDGKLAEPIKVSVISGSVMHTLSKIDGLSDTLTLLSFPTGGCGKMEQYPLPVGFGGPFVRVSEMHVE